MTPIGVYRASGTVRACRELASIAANRLSTGFLVSVTSGGGVAKQPEFTVLRACICNFTSFLFGTPPTQFISQL